MNTAVQDSDCQIYRQTLPAGKPDAQGNVGYQEVQGNDQRIDDSRHRELGDYRAFKAKKRQKQQPDQIQCDIEHVLRVNDHAGNENAGYKNENIIETSLF